MPAPDSNLPAIAAKADDLNEIKKAVEDAAAVSGGLWLSYLFVLFYLAIAAGAVTHTDLLMENPVKLPFLNIELPLRAFFLIAPLLFLITHAYALVHFRMLGLKALRFREALRQQLPDLETEQTPERISRKEIRDKIRLQLPSNVFVQILAGPSGLRGGPLGLILQLINLTTLVLSPVLLLLLLQVVFLPYHDQTVAWVQRGVLLAEIALLWTLHPPTLAGNIDDWTLKGDETDKNSRQGFPIKVLGLVIVGMASGAAIWLSFVVATIPGEGLEAILPIVDKPVREFLFFGNIDPITRRRKSLFSNTLVLPGFNLFEALKIDDPEKLAWKERLIDLRGRHLEKAVLAGANLTKADLTGAHLEGAGLSGAQLQGASLKETQLQGASLDEAQLQGASLYFAQLQSASLKEAQIQGTSFHKTQLQGASFYEPQLQGASLKSAQLQGASFYNANIEAIDLFGSKLWRTDWGFGDILGTSIRGGFSADWNAVYDTPPVKTKGEKHGFWDRATIIPPGEMDRPIYIWITGRPWTDEAYADLRLSLLSIPNGDLRNSALNRIGRLDCHNPDKSLASCDPAVPSPPETQKWKKALEQATVDDKNYKESLTATLQKLICSDSAVAIHILRGVIANGRLDRTGNGAPALFSFIARNNCPVSGFLTNVDKERLHAIQISATPAGSP